METQSGRDMGVTTRERDRDVENADAVEWGGELY